MALTMNITSVKLYSTRELMARLRRVWMLQDKTTLPYKTADISITDIHTDQLAPAQLYMLRGEFEKVRALRWAMLAQHKIDILRLADSRVRDNRLADADADRSEPIGFIEFTVDGADVAGHSAIITILPPIIEGHREADTSLVNIINDGMHRCFLARTSRIVPSVVKITNIPAELPYYAYPLADGWRDVTMVHALDDHILKKYHRFPDYKRYYRNFDSAFANVGGPRGKG